MLFAIFNFYNFSFPFGFSYSALATSMCFMLHSMLFFWHRYELPAVVMGRVSQENPRQSGYISSSPVSTPHIMSPAESGRSTPVSLSNTNHNHIRPVHTAPPMIRRRSIGRSTSFASTNGPLSRASSTGGLFHPGGGDDDESYMFFMGGEVVMHRSSGHAEEHRASSPTEARRNTFDPPVHSSNHHDANNQSEPLLGSDIGTEETEELAVLPMLTLATTSSPVVHARVPYTESSEYDDDDDTSALQAILNASGDFSPCTASYSHREISD